MNFTSLRNAWVVIMILFSHFISAQITPDANGVVYVIQDGTGDGSAWENATSNLQGAIDAPGTQKVFVAVGNYDVPTPSSFVMKEGVAIYGGFAPDNGIDDLSDARILPNHGISEGSVLNGKNERTVIWNDNNGLTNTAILDGFTITNGAGWDGGGIFIRGGSPTLTNLVIKGNEASYRGGGMFIIYNVNPSIDAHPLIANTIIQNNTASSGGGISNHSYAELWNVEITNNNITNQGGGIFNNGQIYFYNCTVAGNTYSPIFNQTSSSKSHFYNSIVFGGVSVSSSYTMNNTLYTTDDIGGIFVNPQAGNYQLKIGSPAINAGNAANYPELDENTLDLAGNPRLKNGTIDQGPYEYQSSITEIVIVPDVNGVVYVRKDADGNGSSWANATGSLQKAIHGQDVQQVWVEIGNYSIPNNGTFSMKNNVAIYGGFDPDNGIDDLSDERILPDAQNTNLGTILNGNGNRRVFLNVFTEAEPLNQTAVLDGFTLTGGRSTMPYGGGGNIHTNSGGGAMYNEYASPKLTNLVIRNNTGGNGAGIYNKNSNPQMSNIAIANNTAQWDGGGIHNMESSPAMLNIRITNNTANYGGGVFNKTSASPQMTNVLIVENNSSNDAGGMYNDDGSMPVLTNTTISGNTANQSKAIHNRNASVAINNSIVYGGIGNQNGGTFTAQYSLVEGSTDTSDGNIDATGITIGTIFSGYYKLKGGSPAINTGSNALYAGLDANTKDLAGNLRWIGSSIDMGVYEFSPVIPDANGIIYVRKNATGDGSGWANATGNLQGAIEGTDVQQVFVAVGEYSIDFGGSLMMKNNVAIYGGFDPDNGIDDLSDERILPDVQNSNLGSVLNANNSRRIIENIFTVANSLDNTALLDGFTLTGGSTSTTGGAIYNEYASPTLTNLVIRNSNAEFGGGVYNRNSSPKMKDIVITNNTVSKDGGAVYNKISSPSMVNIKITNNNANFGAGVFNQTSAFPEMVNVQITDNNTGNDGGGMYNDDNSSPVLINTTIAGNSGGETSPSTAIHNRNASVAINNSIIYGTIGNQNGGSYTMQYSLVQGNSDTSNGNLNASGISVSDIFTDPANGDYTLKNGSVAINAGSNALFTDLDENTLDLAGNPRVYDYANGGIIDLGAYEDSPVTITPDANNILYVNINVSGGNGSGNSWANAIPQLADAMKYARGQFIANNTVYDVTPLKIFVAKGTYKPMYGISASDYTTDIERDNAFVMVKNVQIYGGFDPDNGIDDLSDTRIFGTGGSILSGDIGVTAPTTNSEYDNAYHIVVSSNAVGSALLDGFTIRDAYSQSTNVFITVNTYPVYQAFGAIYTVRSSPSFANCIITENRTYTGGGMYNYQQASPTLTNCSFIHNHASNNGGAIYNNTNASPVITNCSFTENGAVGGGAIYNLTNSSPVITNCSFTENSAYTADGGAIYNSASSPIIINSLIAGNTSGGGNGNGGAIYNDEASSPTLTNVTIANNTGANTLYSTGSGSTTINNSIVFGTISATYTQQYSLINGDYNETGSNYSLTDIFNDNANGDYTLKSSSVAVNAGSNALFTELDENTLDLAGNLRLFGSVIDLGAYELQSLPSVCSASTTWNGTAWSNGEPDSNKRAVIDGNYVLDTDLTACELEVTQNGSLTIPSGKRFTVIGKVTNNASATDFVVESNGILLQNNDVENEGAITVKRSSFPLYRQDYTLWSSPVEGQNLRNFSPQTLYNRFYSYDTSAGIVGEYKQEIFTTTDIQNKLFEPAKGYLIRMPNNWPVFESGSVPGISYPGEFIGTPNNGNISITLSTVNTAVNLVGNPYPSSISISNFFDENPGIEQTLYFWRKRNGVPGSGYASYTSLGLTSSQPEIDGLDLQNTITVGQGFFVRSAGATTLHFNNLMRDSSQNGVLLRSGNQNEKHRIWLNLSNQAEVIGQTLLGYASGATEGTDNGLDGIYFNDSAIALTSLINDQEYAIQARSLPFEASDIVALGFKTNLAGTYTISLANFDGLFTTGQDIFLKDNFNGQLHDLKASAYSFTTDNGIFNNRFSIVYQSTLDTKNPEIDPKMVVVYKKNEELLINSGSILMQGIELFDIRGRLIYALNGVNATAARISNLNIASQVVIIRINSVENYTITKKITY